jgi:hypothetical protein
MLKKILTIGLSLGVATSLMAEPNVPRGDFGAKLKKMAGEQGQFYKGKENFPKDYFLVPNNLPFLAGLSLHHPMSSNLNLTQKQIDQIQAIKKVTVPPVVKASKDIKMLELKLAQNIAIDTNSAKSQYELVDAIGKIRIDLTKAHLQCINDVRAVLTKKQYQELLKYATSSKGKYQVPKKSALSSQMMPRLVGTTLMHGYDLGVSSQTIEIASEIKSIIVPLLMPKIKKIAKLESKMFELSLNKSSKKEIERLLEEISRAKLEASIVQLKCVLMYKEKVSVKDFKKIKVFLQQNKKYMMKYHNVSK